MWHRGGCGRGAAGGGGGRGRAGLAGPGRGLLTRRGCRRGLSSPRSLYPGASNFVLLTAAANVTFASISPDNFDVLCLQCGWNKNYWVAAGSFFSHKGEWRGALHAVSSWAVNGAVCVAGWLEPPSHNASPSITTLITATWGRQGHGQDSAALKIGIRDEHKCPARQAKYLFHINTKVEARNDQVDYSPLWHEMGIESKPETQNQLVSHRNNPWCEELQENLVMEDMLHQSELMCTKKKVRAVKWLKR